MLLGHKLPAPYQSWRVVESDLYDVARQVREYDPDARLLRNEETGCLGLGVFYRRHVIPGGAITLAREFFDLRTDAPLAGEPDQRVMRCMRAYDAHRITDLKAWQRKVTEFEHRTIDKREAVSDEMTEMGERYVHAYGKDIGSTKRAFIPDRERAAA